MTAEELATLFLDQRSAHFEGVPPQCAEPSAIEVWEELITDDPERAWPVFEELLRRTSDDEMLEAVWFRLRLLLSRHYERFHDRAHDLLTRFERFALIAGPEALDAAAYEEKPFDREALIVAYRAMYRMFEPTHALDRLVDTHPERALAIAVEIIHRGVATGWTAFDLMSPLRDVLAKHGQRVIQEVEAIAAESVAVRRVLWRLQRVMPAIDLDLGARLQRAAGTTTDFTDLDVAAPPPQEQLDADERIIEGWFVHEANFWAFSEMNDLCEEDPKLAWDVTLELIARADDEREIGAIAAGPLESLIRHNMDVIWPELWEKAHHNARLVEALRGVWVFESDGDVYSKFWDLMETVAREPN
jgi:hypothetical protein